MTGYSNITDYRNWELASLVWSIESDTLLRTDEHVMREMITELGFRRSGSRIRAAIESAIRDVRSCLKPIRSSKLPLGVASLIARLVVRNS